MINELFKLRYSQQFHCVHFVIAAAQELYGLDYSPCFVGLTKSLDQTLKTSRETVHRNKEIKVPIEGCIVLMTYSNGSSHVGLFFRQRVFHLIERGVERWTIDHVKLLFKRVRYYEPNLHNQKQLRCE